MFVLNLFDKKSSQNTYSSYKSKVPVKKQISNWSWFQNFPLFMCFRNIHNNIFVPILFDRKTTPDVHKSKVPMKKKILNDS